jgi:TolB protein
VEPAWSPDGREIAFISNQSGWHQVWAAAFADGRRASEPRQITFEVGDASSPFWSPDGKAIAYVLMRQRERDIRIAATDGSGVSRSLTSGAKVMMVQWLWARNLLVASGFWAERLPTIRLLPVEGGETTRLVLPPKLVPDRRWPLFDISSDGTLLALFQRARQDDIWVLEAEEGSF